MKWDQYSALIPFRLVKVGWTAKNLHIISTYQYPGCSMTLGMGMRVMKIAKKVASTGPLKLYVAKMYQQYTTFRILICEFKNTCSQFELQFDHNFYKKIKIFSVTTIVLLKKRVDFTENV